MLTHRDDLARAILENHFDGLTADYGLKFCRQVIDTVLAFNLNHTSWKGILTIGHVLEMWEHGDIGVCEGCEE
jgi:hypothetical protein